jgi:hypothetical protein
MQVIKSHNDALTEYINVGAGIGGGFTNTQELKVMKYHEASMVQTVTHRKRK